MGAITAKLKSPIGDCSHAVKVTKQWFLPHDAMRKHAVFAVARCPSVCPSVMLVYCIHIAEDIVKCSVQSGSPNILVFWPQRRDPILRGTPSERVQNTWGGWICHFRLKSPCISKPYDLNHWSVILALIISITNRWS